MRTGEPSGSLFYCELDWVYHLEASNVINTVRLYLDHKAEVPAHMQPSEYPKVIDCSTADAHHIRRMYQRQGFEVIALPL
jgi:hypothetical protein